MSMLPSPGWLTITGRLFQAEGRVRGECAEGELPGT
jgi:hypothetical protein